MKLVKFPWSQILHTFICNIIFTKLGISTGKTFTPTWETTCQSRHLKLVNLLHTLLSGGRCGVSQKIHKTFFILGRFWFFLFHCELKPPQSFLPEVHEDEDGEEKRYDGDGVSEDPDV